MLKFRNNCDSSLVKTVDWLLGYPGEAPNNWRFNNWSKSRRRLASPMSHYLGEICRFSLDRGPKFDLYETDHDDPKQILLNIIEEKNHGKELIYASLERSAVTGEVLWAFIPDSETYYRLYLFDGQEFAPYPDDYTDQGYMVQIRNGDEWSRWGFTQNDYITYKTTRNPDSPWSEDSRKPHNYGFIPCVKVLNKVRDHTHKGVASFDWASVEMAVEICSQTLSSAANYSYFGGPQIVSSDPEVTLAELLGRQQVLTGKMSSESQDTALLSVPAMPVTHKDFVHNLYRNFSDHVGISWIPDNPTGAGGIASSISLKMLYSKTINLAQKMGGEQIRGFCELLKLILLAATFDGIIVGVSATDPDSTRVEVSYEYDIFPLTPQEKQQILGVVEQLQSLGVQTQYALREYYPNLSDDEIQDMLIGA